MKGYQRIKPFKFTNKSIKSLPNNTSKTSTELEVSDTEMIGLKCLVGRSGNKRFLFRYSFKGRKESMSIGRFPEVDVGLARITVTRWRGLLCCGINPKQEREKKLKEQEKEKEKQRKLKQKNKDLPNQIITENMTVSQFFWVVYLPYAKQRKRSWDKDESRFKLYIEKVIGHTPYHELRAIHIYQIQTNMLSGKGYSRAYSPATCNRALALLKTMGNLAYKWDYLPSNEAMKVSLLKENNQRERFFTQKEMQSILKHARFYPNKSAGSLIALLLLTGARRSELQFAKWEDLNIKEKILYVPMTKSGKPREIYLSDEAMVWINRLDRDITNPYIFARPNSLKPISAPRCAFNILLKQSGIKDLTGLCFHTARHSVASLMVSSGKYSLYDVKAQLAHASIQSSERYAKLTTHRQRETGQGISNMLMSSAY